MTAGPLNGAGAGFGAISAQFGWDSRLHPKRLLTFVLDGDAKLPPTPPPRRLEPLTPADFRLDASLAQAGGTEYRRCGLCHGPGAISGGAAPDLRGSPVTLTKEAFAAVVKDGALVERGMPSFPELTEQELEALRHYIHSRAAIMTTAAR